MGGSETASRCRPSLGAPDSDVQLAVENEFQSGSVGENARAAQGIKKVNKLEICFCEAKCGKSVSKRGQCGSVLASGKHGQAQYTSAGDIYCVMQSTPKRLVSVTVAHRSTRGKCGYEAPDARGGLCAFGLT